jgi:RNA polymerase sigma-70 factor, ECF subfamily
MAEFHELLTAETGRLRRFALRLTRDRDNAEDLTQDCMMRALEKRHLFADGTNLGAWLSTIMYNLFISGKRVREPCDRAQPIDDMISMPVSPANQLFHVELMELEQALAGLGQDQQDVVRLVAVDGLRYRQAAVQLGIPVGTVRSRLARARTALADAVDPDMDRAPVQAA